MQIRPVVIGAGEMGRRYLKSLVASGDVYGFDPQDICAVDTHAETGRKTHEMFPTIPVYDSLEYSMLRLKPNCAIITTPASVHKQSLAECQTAGIQNVLIEKPLVEYAWQLKDIRIPRLYTGYLINFSKVVATLRDWMLRQNVFPAEITSLWCQDWYFRNHWIEAASDGKVVHPLVLALMLVDTADPIIGWHTSAHAATGVPHMRPGIRAEARARGYVECDAVSNGTAVLALEAETRSDKSSWISILGSFNMIRNERHVNIVFTRDDEPVYKATLDFDRENGDKLVIRRAVPPEDIVLAETWSGDKVGEQLKAFLHAINGRHDPRLTNFERSAAVTRLLADVPKFPI